MAKKIAKKEPAKRVHKPRTEEQKAARRERDRKRREAKRAEAAKKAEKTSVKPVEAPKKPSDKPTAKKAQKQPKKAALDKGDKELIREIIERPMSELEMAYLHSNTEVSKKANGIMLDVFAKIYDAILLLDKAAHTIYSDREIEKALAKIAKGSK